MLFLQAMTAIMNKTDNDRRVSIPANLRIEDNFLQKTTMNIRGGFLVNGWF